jgi:hypothetical protein
MAGFIEHIQLGPDGEAKVLRRSAWSGPPLSLAKFREIAFAILNDEGEGPKPGAKSDPPAGDPLAADAIRFVDEAGAEVYRYDVDELAEDEG